MTIITETVVRKTGTSSKGLTSAEAEKLCCKPTKTAPCMEETSSWRGYTSQEILERLGISVDENGRDSGGTIVEVKPKNNRPGGNCGEVVKKQILNQKRCCDGVAPLVWDSEESVEIIANNSSGVVRATGGKAPVFVQVRGSGFFLDSGRTIREGSFSGGVVEVFTGNACGSCTVTMDDGCTSTGGLIKSVDGIYKGAYVYTIISGGKSLSSQIRPGFKYLEVNEGCGLDYEPYVWGEMSMSLMVAGLTTWGWNGEFWAKVYEASPTGWVFIKDSAGNAAFADAVAPRGTDPNIFYPDGPVAPGGIGGYDCGDSKWQCV